MSRSRRDTLKLSATLALFGSSSRGFSQSVDHRFLAEAFRLRDEAVAAGDQPYGAVIVLDGIIVGRGRSRVVADGDIARHAERVALSDAQERLGRADLAGASIYSSAVPCMVCQPALARAGLSRMVHGQDGVDGGPPRGS